MAEDVCESWEDLEKSEVLEKKLQQLKLNGDSTAKKKESKTPESSSSSSKDGSPNKNLSASSKTGVKILKRPPQNASKGSTILSTNLNANSEPFIPKSQVELEDTTRTQFKPKLVILKREKPDKNKNASGNPCDRSGASTSRVKTYEEREKDYMKARERILGSAVATEEVPEPPFGLQTSSPLLPTPVGLSASQPYPRKTSPSNTRTGQMEVPLLRQPEGPSIDGNRGFTRVKR